jgi:hypothetical protein
MAISSARSLGARGFWLACQVYRIIPIWLKNEVTTNIVTGVLATLVAMYKIHRE